MSAHGVEESVERDRYALDATIATGGMGEVWRARDTLLDRVVAVKLLKNEYAEDATFRQRFLTEARNAASLHHPHIATVFDFGEREKRPYLVMELVEGQPLSQLLREGRPMPADRARDLVSQAAAGLGEAHRKGLVHRDVKPANLLVTPDGQVKVTDFGIARAADAVPVTRTGDVIGTPQYLSPEQAEGRRATAASDVYSLGVVLYEALVGERPFTGDTPITTALAHLREPVPELPDTVPGDLRAITRRALAKDPAHRYADGDALGDALRNGDAGEPTMLSSMPDPAETQVVGAPAVAPATVLLRDQPRRSSGFPWLWFGVAAAVVIALGVVVALTEHTSSPTTPSAGSSPPTHSSTPASQATPTSADVVRSRYLGMTRDDATKALKRLGFTSVADDGTRTNPGGHQPGTVADVSPTGTQPVTATIGLSVWGPVAAPPKPTPPQQQDKPHGHGNGQGKGNGKHGD